MFQLDFEAGLFPRADARKSDRNQHEVQDWVLYCTNFLSLALAGFLSTLLSMFGQKAFF